ncbi:MAG: N-acetylmuramoyl-L-alanine amidase, partial [Selenomonas sp.]|nr:N-acetylmuramoyl-L-alanine amidase [Selenomonas sp.]
PTPSAPNPPVQPAPEKPSLRPSKRPDLPKPGNLPTQRRIASN